jgi:hypothetical protein
MIECAGMLFEDYFSLREHLYDFAGFAETLPESSLDVLTHSLLSLDVNQLASEFVLGNFPLGGYISRVQQRILDWRNPLLSTDHSLVYAELMRSFAEYGATGLLFASIPPNIWGRLKSENPEVYQSLRIYLDSATPSGT